MPDFVLLTCEHGGNRVPAPYAALFRGRRALLESHRGYDPGALELARTCGRRLKAPLHFATVTRLLIELNRSEGHAALFSVVTKPLSRAERDTIRDRHYTPYRARVETDVARAIGDGQRVVHLSLHTFTPQLNGEIRRADVGLLYDPTRPGERLLCGLIKQSLANRRADLTVRRNYPYFGKADGFTTSLRKKWGPSAYVGIELEVNQSWPFGERRPWRRLQRDLTDSLAESLPRFCDV